METIITGQYFIDNYLQDEDYYIFFYKDEDRYKIKMLNASNNEYYTLKHGYNNISDGFIQFLSLNYIYENAHINNDNHANDPDELYYAKINIHENSQVIKKEFSQFVFATNIFSIDLINFGKIEDLEIFNNYNNCMLGLQLNCYYIKYMKNKNNILTTDEMENLYLTAIRYNYWCVVYITSRTYKICLEIMKTDPNSHWSFSYTI